MDETDDGRTAGANHPAGMAGSRRSVEKVERHGAPRLEPTLHAIVRTMPPSTLSAAPLVAEASFEAA